MINLIFSSEPKQGEINDREITYSLWKYKNEINDNVKIEIKNDIKQEIIKSSSSSSSSSSESSSSTDSSNYESDEKTDKVIIHNYDIKEPESKLIMILILLINQKKNINLLKKEN